MPRFLVLFVGALALPATAFAQESDIEAGATQPSQVETQFSASGSTSGGGRASGRGAGGGARIGLQARIDAVNTLGLTDPALGGLSGGPRLFVPIVTPGVRLLDNRLFAGLGLGFDGFSVDDGNTDTSRGSFSLSPLVSYDVLSDGSTALSLVGWFNLASLGETEVCDDNSCNELNNDATAIGLSLGAGVRGNLLPGLAIGTEFGWAFLSISEDAGDDSFVHGVFGTILFEGTVGL